MSSKKNNVDNIHNTKYRYFTVQPRSVSATMLLYVMPRLLSDDSSNSRRSQSLNGTLRDDGTALTRDSPIQLDNFTVNH